MSENRTLLTDMADGLFAELATADCAAAWPRLAEAGFATLLVPEDKGGFGGDWGDLFAVLRLAGSHALAAPLGETIVAHKLLAEAGIEAPDGPIALLDRGYASFGRDCAAVLAPGEGGLKLYPQAALTLTHGTSPDGNPRAMIPRNTSGVPPRSE